MFSCFNLILYRWNLLVLKNYDFLKEYLGDLKPCIICNKVNFELWAKLDFFEAKKELFIENIHQSNGFKFLEDPEKFFENL